MSVEGARKHWRFLAGLFTLFVLIAVTGPLIVYAIWEFAAGGGFRGAGLQTVAVAILIGVAWPAWFFFMLWSGDKADRSTDPDPDAG